MEHVAVAWCFFRRAVKSRDVVGALTSYAPLRGARFHEGVGVVECSGVGFSVRLVPTARLRAVLAAIDVVRSMTRARIVQPHLAHLRASSMVIAVEAWLDDASYQGTIYEARAPFGPTLDALPAEAVGACEALNVNLASAKPLLFDRAAGFYPTV